MDPIMEIYISIMDIHKWFMDVHKWQTRQAGTRSRRYFRENYSTDDIIYKQILKIPKLHINNLKFSLELVAMTFVSSQLHPARNRPLKSTPMRPKTEV